MCSMKREAIDGKITQEDFYHAFEKTAPSVSTKDRHLYEDVKFEKNCLNVLVTKEP
jgi:hypothetical protein